MGEKGARDKVKKRREEKMWEWNGGWGPGALS